MKNDFGKIPPNAIQIEDSLLGALMIEPEYFTQICAIIKEDSFYCQDQGNSGIIKKYLCEFNPNAKVEDLTLETIANSVKVSRYRNHLLIEHSYLDERDKHKPKQRFVNKGA